MILKVFSHVCKLYISSNFAPLNCWLFEKNKRIFFLLDCCMQSFAQKSRKGWTVKFLQGNDPDYIMYKSFIESCTLNFSM